MSTNARALVGIHGFSFAPGIAGYDPGPLFTAWEVMLGRPVDGFAWYSAPLGLSGEARALAAGYPQEYAWAFNRLAPAAAVGLTSKFAALHVATGQPVDAVCHSLGSKPLRMALGVLPAGVVGRVLVLDGAEIQRDAAPLGRAEYVLNAVVHEDLVLRDLGSLFNMEALSPCIGQAGLGFTIPTAVDVSLDSPTVQQKAAARGWALSGTMPGPPLSGDLLADLRRRGDHWASYLDQGNWPLYRAFFDGFDPRQLAA